MQPYCPLVDLLWNILPLHTWNFAWFNFTYVFMHTNIPQTCKKSWNGSVKMLFKHITVFQHKFSLTMLATIASVEVSIVNVDNIVSIGSMPQSLFILLSRICSVHVKFSVHELAVQDRILYPFNLKGAADKNLRISSNNYHRPTVILISVTCITSNSKAERKVLIIIWWAGKCVHNAQFWVYILQMWHCKSFARHIFLALFLAKVQMTHYTHDLICDTFIIL